MARSGRMGAGRDCGLVSARIVKMLNPSRPLRPPGNIGLAMTEASLHIGVFTDNQTAGSTAVVLEQYYSTIVVLR